MLLARLEREHEAALALEVGRLTDDPAGHAADELLAGGEKAVVRAAVALVVADRLPLADRHRAAVVPGRLEQAQRGEVDVRDGQRAALGRGGRELGRGLEAAEGVRLLEDRDRRVGGAAARRAGSVVPPVVGDLDDLHPEARRVGLHDLAHHRVERLGEHDLRPAGVRLAP